MIKEYLTYQKEVKHLAESTLQEYEKDLREFVTYMAAKQKTWSSIVREDLEVWIMSMTGSKLKAATIRRRIATVRNIFTYAFDHCGLATNPSFGIESPKLPKQLPDTGEVEQFLKYLATTATSRRALRMHAYVAIALETGMRISEIMNLQSSQFDRKNRCIYVHGKGNKQRIVYYGELTRHHLAAYNRHACGFIFSERDERQLREDMIVELDPFIRHCHPHMLRHTFATQVLNMGTDLYTLSRLMGHESVATTERYINMPQQSIARTAGHYLGTLN